MHTTKTKNKIHYKGCPVCGASSAAIQINSRMFEVLDSSESDNNGEVMYTKLKNVNFVSS